MHLTTPHEIELHQESAREREREMVESNERDDERDDEELEREELEETEDTIVGQGEDAFLDSYMEDRIGGTGYEDYEPSPYDGTYSED